MWQRQLALLLLSTTTKRAHEQECVTAYATTGMRTDNEPVPFWPSSDDNENRQRLLWMRYKSITKRQLYQQSTGLWTTIIDDIGINTNSVITDLWRGTMVLWWFCLSNHHHNHYVTFEFCRLIVVFCILFWVSFVVIDNLLLFLIWCTPFIFYCWAALLFLYFLCTIGVQ
jgi:hypothetical protein